MHEDILSGLREAGVEPRRVRDIQRLRSAFTMVACEFGFGVAPRCATRSLVNGVTFCVLPRFHVNVETHAFFRSDSTNPLIDTFVGACVTAGRAYQARFSQTQGVRSFSSDDLIAL